MEPFFNNLPIIIEAFLNNLPAIIVGGICAIYILVLVVAPAIMFIHDLLFPPPTREEFYKHTPTKRIENCVVCKKQTSSKNETLFYEGSWVLTGNNGGIKEEYFVDENHNVHRMGTYKEVKATQDYYEFRPNKKVLLRICNSCLNKKRRSEIAL